MSWSKSLFLIGVLVVLSGCGFKPIYGDRHGQNVKAEFSAIKIELIEDRIGQQLHNHLLDKINPFGRPASPRYSLTVKLSESKRELAVKKSEIATRANLIFIASFNLTGLRPTSKALLTGSSEVVSSYNILQSDYATSVAEKDARRRAVRELSAEIANRLAVYFQLQNDPQNREIK